ncbi:platelet-activating factor acetylhydrolase plasma/intracellular isoform II [Streptomyces microflavus DSM 40593]|uniref:Platelet-activating factor acetylhydrolase plasma/intracellular isoform II n=1 Tax=Streptomyces microflavus DSM 40593 TaxID=1303692 RepID=N0CHN1_STRMI|nr:dienelactone hydrolase family protein [Streptomyces microflavus]AGK75205.1 platelet-activating factor acetylhydrolase plasma/intracellular isoform II [Streptomyces microflavus DSM 40593]
MPSTITGLPLSGPEALTEFGAITLVLARWLPDRFRGPATLAAGALLVGSVTVLVVGGLRWQLVPVVAAAAVAAPFALVPMVRRRTGRTPWRARWWLALPGSAVCAALIASGPVSAWALPVPEFPEPSGRFPVGTQVLEFSTRPEGDGRDEESRTLVTQLWYPAGRSAPDAPRMPYLGRTEAESRTVSSALAGYAGVPGFLLDGLPRARSHAVPGAPAAREGGRLPVVLFSPGLGGVRTQNTAWAEELASHGYVVAAVDHPYDSAAVVLADGRTLRTRVSATGDREEDAARAEGWTRTRAADLRAVLNRLTRMDREEADGTLAGRLDTGRVAVAGHSIGGAAALQAARQDRRFDAVIDLDGFPHGPTGGHLGQPVLALTQEIGPGTDPDYLPRLTRVLELGAATNYRLTVPGTAHLTFTDAPLYLPPVPGVVGSLGRTEGHRITAAASLSFLDATLRGAPTDLPTALAAHGEVTVHRPKPHAVPQGTR